MLNIAAAVRFREFAGLSKSQLAVAAGISLSYLSEIESGTKTNVSPAVIKKIADALNVPVAAILASPVAA